MNPIIEKIRKLLALANSPNENESASALAKARELQRQYAISNKDLETAEYQERFFQRPWRSMPKAIPSIFTILRDFFKVYPIYLMTPSKAEYGVCWVLVGKGHDILIAEYVFIHLLRSSRKAWLKYSKGFPKRLKRATVIRRHEAFIFGFFHEIAVRLLVQNEAWYNETGIVLREDLKLKSWVQQRHGDIKTVNKKPLKCTHEQSLLSGMNAGRSIDLNKPIGEAQKTALRIE